MARIELRHIDKQFRSQPDMRAFGGIAFNLFGTLRRHFRAMHGKEHAPLPPSSFHIQDLNLTIPDGKTMVVLGPSGCGKSTLLRTIAGLLPPDAGDVLYNGVNMAEIPPGERHIGMIFQNYALYPHFNSRTNILSYFFFKKRTPELDAQAQEKYRQTSELLGVDIEYLMDRKPTYLSGGERQRVALGRCITRDPQVFLLDEPFSNLDQTLRETYRVQLKKLLRQFSITTVYVTHDQQEALILGDVLAIMDVGHIAQVGAPEEIYHTPASMFVAEFLNLDIETPSINFLPGACVSPGLQDYMLGVRPEDVTLCDATVSKAIRATVSDVRHVPLKQASVVCLALDAHELYARLPLTRTIRSGNRVHIQLRSYHLFDQSTGLRLRTSQPGIQTPG